jgi:hypothetical protein
LARGVAESGEAGEKRGEGEMREVREEDLGVICVVIGDVAHATDCDAKLLVGA